MASKSLTFDIYGRDKSASKTIRGVRDEADGLGSSFKRMGPMVAAGIAVAGAAVIKFGADSVQAYAEAEESQNRLAFAYEQFPALADTNIEAMRRLNEELAKKTRYDDDAYAVGQAQLAQYGLTGQQIMDLTPLLADYAGKTGKDIPSAAEDLGKALLGQGRALKDIGIDFADTGSVAGNFDSIMQGLRGQVGGFAEQDATTAAGKLDIMANKFGEVQEAVGEKLIGPLSDAMDELSDSGAVEDMGTALGDVVQGFTDLEEKTGFLSDFASDMGDVKQMFDDIAAAGEAFSSGDIGTIGDWFGEEFGEGGLMGSIFGGEWFKNPPVPPLPDSFRTMFGETQAVTTEGMDGVRGGMGGGFSAIGGDMSMFQAATGAQWGGVWTDANGRTQTGVGSVATTTGTGLLDVLGRVLGFSGSVGPQFGTAWGGANSETVGGWGNIESSTGAGVGRVGAKVGEIPGVVRAPFAGAGSWLSAAGGDIVNGLIGGITGMIGSAARAAADLANATVTAAKNALGIKSPSRVFREIGEYVGAGYDEGIEKAMDSSHRTMEALVMPPEVASSQANSSQQFTIVLESRGGVDLTQYIDARIEGQDATNVITSKMGKQR